MPFSIRAAREDDLERLVDIHADAFPDGRGRDVRRRHFAHNPLGRLEDLVVASDDGALLGHGFLFPLEGWFGGARVRMAGLASIGVAPEARGRGIASRLIEYLHEAARAHGDALAVLYAFRQGFYERLSYRPASPYRRLRLHPASIPYRLELRARAADGRDWPALRACWDHEAKTQTGALVRGEAIWEARLSDEDRTWLVVEGKGGVEGYIAWSLSQAEAHAAVTMEVRDMAAQTDVAARSLWGLVASQRDQVADVRIDVAADDPIDRALVDPDRGLPGVEALEHPIGELAAGPMVRVLDPATALSARGYPADGSLVLAVEEERFEMVVSDGAARVAPTRAEPSVRMGLPALSAIAFGALPASHAARLGWLDARDARALALADALFALPAYFSRDPF